MASIMDILAQEKAVAAKAVTTLRKDFRSAINESVKVRGESKKSTVRSRFRGGHLDRITFVAPYWIFMQHNGFEGTKKNSVRMRLKATDVLNKALEKSNLIDDLVNDIANLRGDELFTRFNFDTNGI